MKKFYIVESDERTGPFSLEELNIKDINASTLIWHEDLTEWTEARYLVELKSAIKKVPPPVPKTSDATYKVEAEIEHSQKEKIISQKTDVNLAKTIFNYIVYALIIGLLSLSFFYYIIYDADKFDNLDVNSVHFDGSTMGLDISDFQGFIFNTRTDIPRYIKIRKEHFTKRSYESAIITLLASGGVLLLFRYIYMRAN